MPIHLNGFINFSGIISSNQFLVPVRLAIQASILCTLKFGTVKGKYFYLVHLNLKHPFFDFLYVLLVKPGFAVCEIRHVSALSVKKANVQGNGCPPFVS